jgi:hypothetical protein
MIKKNLILSLVFGVAFTSQVNAAVTINLVAGVFTDESMTPLSDTALIQLITRTTTSTSFSAPTDTSFIGANETILGAFSLDSATTTAIDGVTAKSIIFPLSSMVATGQELILRWYPTLTVSSVSPYAGAKYGEYTGTGWTIGADDSVSPLSFLTQATGLGSLPDSAGVAQYQVVPEPSTYALGGLLALGVVVAARRRKQK